MFSDVDAVSGAACSASVQAPSPCLEVTQQCPCPFFLACLASTAASLAPGGGSESYPWLLGAGSMLPRLDRRVVLLPRCPQATDVIPAVPGVLRDIHQSTPKARSSSCLPRTHKVEGKTLMLMLPWGAASPGCAPAQDWCPWSTALNAPLSLLFLLTWVFLSI